MDFGSNPQSVNISCVITLYRFYIIFPNDTGKSSGSMKGYLPGAETREVCGAGMNVDSTFDPFQIFILW